MKTLIIALLLSFTCLVFAAPDSPINTDLAKHALVVMRAKKISELPEADKYRWYEVEVIEVLENRAEQIFLSTPIKIAALSSKSGIPDGISTLYIERYGDSDKNLWKLVGGSATAGVSHTSK
jgi:hypothetical protein